MYIQNTSGVKKLCVRERRRTFRDGFSPREHEAHWKGKEKSRTRRALRRIQRELRLSDVIQ